MRTPSGRAESSPRPASAAQASSLPAPYAAIGSRKAHSSRKRASDAPPPSPDPPSGRGTACSSPRLPRAASWMPGRRSPVELLLPRVRPGRGRSARSVNRAGCIGCWDRARRAARSGPRPVHYVAPSSSGRPCPWRSEKGCRWRRKEAVPGWQSGSSRCDERIVAPSGVRQSRKSRYG